MNLSNVDKWNDGTNQSWFEILTCKQNVANPEKLLIFFLWICKNYKWIWNWSIAWSASVVPFIKDKEVWSFVMCSRSVGFDFESFHNTSFLKIKLSLFRFAPPIFFSKKGKRKKKKRKLYLSGCAEAVKVFGKNTTRVIRTKLSVSSIKFIWRIMRTYRCRVEIFFKTRRAWPLQLR